MTGRTVPVLYAKSDPMANRRAGTPPPEVSPVPVEAIGAGFGLLVALLISLGGLRSLGMAAGSILAFLAGCAAAYGIGLLLGLRLPHARYTVQWGDNAVSSSSFTNDFIPGVVLRLDSSGLNVNGRSYGVVPDHAHVWLKGDGVYVNNVKQ